MTTQGNPARVSHLALVKTAEYARELAAIQKKQAALYRSIGRYTNARICEENFCDYLAHAEKLEAEAE